MTGIGVRPLLDAVVSHAASLGLFERINTHEPTSAPGSGLTAAVWADSIQPVESSGLASTSVRVAFHIRLFTSAATEPRDAIDPEMVDAVDALLAAYSADYTLGGLVRAVDLLGIHGDPLGAQAGYVQQDTVLSRVMTITLPLLVNDVWDQGV